MKSSDEKTEFDLSNHVFCVEEPLTMEEITRYCQQQVLVAPSDLLDS